MHEKPFSVLRETGIQHFVTQIAQRQTILTRTQRHIPAFVIPRATPWFDDHTADWADTSDEMTTGTTEMTTGVTDATTVIATTEGSRSAFAILNQENEENDANSAGAASKFLFFVKLFSTHLECKFPLHFLFFIFRVITIIIIK